MQFISTKYQFATAEDPWGKKKTKNKQTLLDHGLPEFCFSNGTTQKRNMYGKVHTAAGS